MKKPARVEQLHDWLEAGLRDEHGDWIKAYGMLAAKVLEQRGADARDVQGVRAHPMLADQLLGDADKAMLNAMVSEIFSAIDAAEAHAGQYTAGQVPAAMLTALSHLYPESHQRQPGH